MARLCPACGQAFAASGIPACTCTVVPAPDSLALAATLPAEVRGSSDSASATIAESAAPVRGATSGQSFGRYILLEILGAGAMGVVWRAWDPVLDRTVALKLLRVDTASADLLARFQREAQVAARLRHPHVVSVFDVGAEHGAPYLAMEFVAGRTFAQRLAERRTTDPAPPLAAEIEILAQVAEAVAYAHAQGVVHRDLKPGNVLIDAQGCAHVADFGLAREVDRAGAPDAQRVTRAGQLLGSPGYMSPEQARGEVEAIGPRSDVWALGVILYELLAGTIPFRGDTPWATLAAVCEHEPVPPARLRPAAPLDLQAVCLAALEKDPARRTAGAHLFAEDLRRWQRGEPVEARGPDRGARAARWFRRHGRALAAALGVVLGVGVSLVWGWLEYRAGEARTRAILESCSEAVRGFRELVARTNYSHETYTALTDQTLGMLDRIVREYPQLGVARAWRGRMLASVGRMPEAEKDFATACRMAPNSATVWLLRGTSRLDWYAAGRKLPSLRSGPDGAELEPPAAETPQEIELRRAGNADIERGLSCAGDDPLVGDVEVRLARATTRLYAGMPGDFEACLDILQGIPGPLADHCRGLALYHLGRFAEAAAQLERTLVEWKEDLHARIVHGCALQGEARWKADHGIDPRPDLRRALDDFLTVLRHEPPDFQAWVVLVAGRIELALAEEDLGGSGDDVLAQVLVDLQGYLQAGGVAQTARSYESLAWRLRGEFSLRREQDPRSAFRRSLEILRVSAEDDPTAAETWNQLGIGWQRLGEVEHLYHGPEREAYDESERHYAKAIGLDPQQVAPRVNRATLHRSRAVYLTPDADASRAELEGVVADCEAAQRQDPSSLVAHSASGIARSDLARLALRRGEDALPLFQAATRDFDAALALHARNPRVRRFRGIARVEVGRLRALRGEDPGEDWRRADEDLLAASKLRDLDANRERVILLRLQGRFAAAEALLADASRWRAGDRSFVEARLRTLRALLPFAGEPWVGAQVLARESIAAGDYVGARVGFEHVLALEKDAPDANPGRRRLWAGDRYNVATLEALAAAGKTHPDRPGVAPPEAEAEAHRVRAFALLREALAAEPMFYADLRVDPEWEGLREDARYVEVMRGGK